MISIDEFWRLFMICREKDESEEDYKKRLIKEIEKGLK